MEIFLAEYLGFCYGVKRAIKIARANTDGKCCTLGPIIHNPQMVEKLRAEGVDAAENLSAIDEGTVIIRSHGVGPKVYEEIKAKGLKIVDATCPHVKKAQLSARELVQQGYDVVIVGEKNHPEVKSIFEWAEKRTTIIETVAETESFVPCQKLGIVSQTTVSSEHFEKVVLQLLRKSSDIKILRTICTATDQRQKAAMELAEKVDVMIVIGGRNSANTTKLAKLCEKKCTTYHIETADEISQDWFAQSKKVGITAGASTPDWIIKEVEEKLREF
ncbi:MAG: 4-hydroxy-3-methylbut-2-enyl diphosphate reductase [Selenomonadaceae bacterium]|nr:4-hydroxy-3-methylbut-2-enyl diphosphate reductase [Selenomonadaceae bacterium]